MEIITDIIRKVAKDVGIAEVIILDSETDVKTQLSRLTGEEHLPILLISWDIEFKLEFDENGFIQYPPASIVALLLNKPEEKTASTMQKLSEEVGILFTKFIQALNTYMRPLTDEQPITGAAYKLLPKHGITYHTGVLGRFTVKTNFNKC